MILRWRGMLERCTLLGLAWAVPIALVLLVAIQYREAEYLLAHANWSGWADQMHYMQSARAWATLDLDPARHKYPAGYALMAAPFIYLLPNQPFLLPDLACAAISLVLFTRLCERLAPDMRHARAIAPLCFLLATCGGSAQLRIWAEPWSTTAACPFMLGILLLALKAATPHSQASNKNGIFCLGLTVGLATITRPVDIILLAMPCAIYVLAERCRTAPRWVAARDAALYGLAGLVLGLLPFLAIHLAIYGTGGSPYFGYSASFGFEWRLIRYDGS